MNLLRVAAWRALTGVAGLLALGNPCLAADSSPDVSSASRAACEGLGEQMRGRWPDPSTHLTAARFHETPEPLSVRAGSGQSTEISLPPHCEVLGVMRERVGADGQSYAVHFHLRLPVSWNQRFFFQGGGGTNGEIGNAVGILGEDSPPALMQGFAVVSQDSGHDNATNRDVMHGGVTAFGFDPQARADYGHASLQPVSQAAKALVSAYYRADPRFSYFAGCSKGGADGMAAVQRYPREFDGVLASAPGFSLPRAAVAQAWDVQALLAATEDPSPASLARAFSDQDLTLAAQGVLAACDADDGLADGIVGAFEHCSGKKVHAALEHVQCRETKTSQCLASGQIKALERVYSGAVDGKARALYSDWPWDAGIASPGWRFWKLGATDGSFPALNVTLGGSSLAAVFTTPPTRLPDDPAAQFDYVRRFDFRRDAPRIYATSARFPRSAWEDISARSPDLSAFRSRSGKLIVPHGVSDPVFSINDTLAWYREVERRTSGEAATFVRVFPVPGMTHCGGGPATDRYDAFGALVSWVERGQAPERILASAGPAAPWPGRTRPLCPYPQMARYKGTGNIDQAESFACQ